MSNIAIIIFSIVFFIPWQKVCAEGRFFVNTPTTQVVQGVPKQLSIMIDVGSTEVVGTSIILSYNPGDVTIDSVSNGNFLSTVQYYNFPAEGKINIQNVGSSGEKKNGSGTLATITVVSKKSTGTGAVGMLCQRGRIDTSIINAEFKNIYTCVETTLMSLTYVSQSITPVASSTPVPTRPILPLPTKKITPRQYPTPTLMRIPTATPSIYSSANGVVTNGIPSPTSKQVGSPIASDTDPLSVDDGGVGTKIQNLLETNSPLFILAVLVAIGSGVGGLYFIVQRVRSPNEIVQNFTQTPPPAPQQPSVPQVPLANDPFPNEWPGDSKKSLQ